MEKTSEHKIHNIKNENSGNRTVPPVVVSRAKSAGAVGEAWLAGLDGMISELEKMWHISVGEALSGGSHAFVAYADGQDGTPYVLKLDMPEDLGGEFESGIKVLETAGGQGYPKLYAYDLKRKACLLERLGKPLERLGYPVPEQLRIICDALQKTWKIPVTAADFAIGNTAWFRAFIGEAWEKLWHPCSPKVLEQAFSYLQSREEAANPSEFVLLHGDAHSGNTLGELSGQGYKLIDPDGILYEKAYDLGVLMREWVTEYKSETLKKGKERCRYLSRLTGVPEPGIWEWGFVQTVSTAFVLLQTGREELGQKMLRVAERWAPEDIDAAPEPEYRKELLRFLTDEYGFPAEDIRPAKKFE